MAIEDTSFGIQSITLRDNSTRNIDTVTSLSILPSLHPIFSSDGPDNVLVEKSDYDEVLKMYGDDFADSSAYGLQNLNVEKSLEGGSSVYLCRLLPKDATRAHLVISVGVKSDENIPIYKRDKYGDFELDSTGNKIQLTASQVTTTTVEGNDEDSEAQEVTTTEEVPAFMTGLKIKLFVSSLGVDELKDVTSLTKLQDKMKLISNEDGYKIIPLIFMSYYANGDCGNNYGVRIINDKARDAKVNDGRRYQMFLVKKTPTGAVTLSIGNGLSFSFNPKATVSKTIPTLEGLQKVYQNYGDDNQKKQVQIEYYADNYEALKAEVESILGNETVVTEGFDPNYEFTIPSKFEEVDFINGTNIEGYQCDNIVIEKDETTPINLSNPNYMSGGTNGSFDTLTGDQLESTKTELLKEFYNGDIATDQLLNVLKCDAGIMYDANYPTIVKEAMTNLLKWRRDICAVFDCGFTETLEDAVNVAKIIKTRVSSLGEGGENYAIVPHCGITADRTVNVRVTGTYEFAYGLANLYNTHPFSVYAGKPGDYGCVRKTIFDWVVEEQKPKGYQEKLAKANKLYWAVDLGKALSEVAAGNVTGRNVYFYSNASLYSEPVSKLSEFRNGILVNDIRRVLKLTLCKYTFDTDGAESAIAKATEELRNILSRRYPSNVTINLNLYQTDRDRLLNQATCEVEVLFPDIFETWNCIIIADRQQG